MWPKFGKLFLYGGMNTTNHIEEHWEWIKYTLLQGKVNWSLQNLMIVIIGCIVNKCHIGSLTLMDYFKQVQCINKYLSILSLYYINMKYLN